MNHFKKLSRRSFVKETSLLTGGLILGPSLVSATPFFTNEKKLKLAVIGCGGRGTGATLQALKADENVVLVAMADAFQDRLDKAYGLLSKEFKSDKINVTPENKFVGFGSYKKAIDEADVVILATPPGFRPQHFEYAISQGKHVFMEKPVATDVAGVKKVLEAAKIAKEKKLNVVVGLQRRYQQGYIEAFKKIQQGTMGKIVSGQVYWNGGGVWMIPRDKSWSEMEYQMRNWYYFNWICGDHILEQHIHNIDVANWFIGEYPIKAQGMGGREVRKGKEYGEIFDHHFVEFEYPGGAVISSQCRHQKKCLNRVSETFQGTLGTAHTHGGGVANIKSYSGEELFSIATRGDNPYQTEHNLLFQSIRSGGVIADAENGAKSTMAAIMGRMATYTGNEVTWDAAMNSGQVLVPNEMELTWNSIPPVVPDADGFYAIPIPGVTTI